MAFLETRVKETKFQKISAKINKYWEFSHNYAKATNGRIWLGWNPKRVNVKVLGLHAQGLHCEILDLMTGKLCEFVAIYAYNTNDQRKELWQFISEICQRTRKPLLLGGDFNTILQISDRLNGNPVSQADIQDFENCLQMNELTPLRMVGNEFTWCNNQVGEDRIYSLIDRCIGNTTWFSAYPPTIVEILERNISDHCPLALNTGEEIGHGSPLFRFMNVLSEHPEFNAIIEEKWQGQLHENLLLNIWYKLKVLKEPLKSLNNTHFRNITEKLGAYRDDLRGVQRELAVNHLSVRLINKEKELLAEIEKWSNIDEKIWHQKSRIDWIKLGDGNTKFFHSYAKARICTKTIKGLVNDSGVRCNTQHQIKEEIKSFYMKIMGSAAEYLPMPEEQVIRRGAILQHETQLQLCNEVTEQEIKEALFSMNSCKAPGIDGFNVHFYKTAWNYIGSDVCRAVKHFFQSGYMPRAINSTLLTLIPKTDHAQTVKDYRPIACCSIFYKIISKVIANRLQNVLGGIVSENQSAFIKGRTIFDNILLSHELIKGYNRKGISPRCMIKIDIQKAYDYVEWLFMKYLLIGLGFPFQFVKWIMACLTTVTYMINENFELV